jgi:DNA-directed RNA polymerase II subunit RPB2
MVQCDLDLSSLEFEKYTWDVIQSYFDESQSKCLIKHQVESYNDFVLNKLEQIIEGFNDLLIHHKYIPELDDFKYTISINVSKPVMTRPVVYEKDGSTRIMTPTDARQRNFSYSSNVYVEFNIHIKWYDNENQKKECKKIMRNVNIGKVPIMVGSNYCILENPFFKINSQECKYDYGGYFIINGNEKVVISHDRIAENKTYVFLDNKLSQYSHIAEIRSVPDNVFGPPKLTSLKLSSKQTQFGHYIRMNIHHIRIDVPVFILFRALGFESDRDIMKLCVYDINDPYNKILMDNLKGSIEDSNTVLTRLSALDYLQKFLNISGFPKEIMLNKSKRINIILDILKNDFLPHVGDDRFKKALYLGYMVNKLMKCFLGIYPMDDRDSYLNKRVDTPGIMVANLFRQYYGKVVKDVKNMIYKELNNGSWKVTNDLVNLINKSNIYKIVKPSTIESGLKYGLATGNWGIKNTNAKQGVAQVLNRLTYNATISHLRRVNTPMEKSGKLIQPRKLHNTQWGIICPSETPEGSSVGLVKNISIMSTITIASDSRSIYTYLNDFGVIHIGMDNIEEYNKNTWIFLNGNIVGIHKTPKELYQRLLGYKRRGIINIYTSISWDISKNMINISTEAGRCVRPIYIVNPDNNKLLFDKKYVLALKNKELSWKNMIADITLNTKDDSSKFESIIEYVDVEENNTLMIASVLSDLKKGNKGERLQLRYTHMEIHPSLILGVLASNIPFSNHNQAPRNTYQSAMGKQAIGLYATNFKTRLDTLSHVLNYPQQPLVKTNMSTLLNLSNMPCGTNVIVAIATYTGYNQEDSIILNRSSVQRGLFTSTFYRTLKEQCNKNLSTGEEEIFCNPKNMESFVNKPQNYNKIDEDGFVSENTFVEAGDVLIGKCMPQKTSTSFFHKDNSITMKNNEIGYIDMSCTNDKYFKNTSADGYSFCKIKIRNFREPTIGDKLSSNHAQKGSIGVMYNQEDLPYTKEGLVPDIIINPHAIPSRMTIAQLIETIMGKACASLGTVGNATPFTSVGVNDICNILGNECKLEPHGNQLMYNSRTGEQMKTSIFVGPTYYQRLKHMVCDKIHSRNSNGPVVLLTRQPAEGRARDGGLRLGEMEVECNWGHGTMNFLKERFIDCSDNYRIFTCKKCGNIANVNPNQNIYICNLCNNKTNFAEIRIPFASKLLFQEIQSMGINTKFYT